MSGEPVAGQALNGIATALTVVWVLAIAIILFSTIRVRNQLFDTMDQLDEVKRAVGNVETMQGKLRTILSEHPDDAGPAILEVLDELTELDEKQRQDSIVAKATRDALRKPA